MSEKWIAMDYQFLASALHGHRIVYSTVLGRESRVTER